MMHCSLEVTEFCAPKSKAIVFFCLFVLKKTMKLRTCLIGQLVKNLHAMQETPVQFLGREDLLEKGKAAHSSILAWRIVHGVSESDTTEPLSHTHETNLHNT